MRKRTALSLIVATLALSGCSPAPPPSSPPTPSPTQAAELGGYGDLSQACIGVADDVITLHRIKGSVEVGIDQDGAEAIIDEIDTMNALAPSSLTKAYQGVEEAIERMRFDIGASPTPARSRSASPAPSFTQTTTPTPSPTPQASAPQAVDAAAAKLTTWLKTNCNSR